MRKAFLTALAAATLFSVGMIAEEAEATPAAASLPAGAASASFVREAAVVCGANGCNPVHTRSEQKRKFKTMEYTKPVRQSAISPFAGVA